ncbi:ubiquitin-protein ligase Sel1/Ubx2 [Pochonia chlamydosporia 170]|uniref:Ubiquitin-protein ligase Sel1/Ubx2 n=1 Tax=Pochonia chlamydosporia 170 TaxID=1380566 RepID=A0A179FNE3_METCM|nr:ubiquitin-protein ligase Sel1/Ubx2 [Pochonia chlamydosporia 170]OAQ66867.1 ubiquitin-protein ligase Sel1/Ubx2 [Pochonia chlamydosporia 170]
MRSAAIWLLLLPQAANVLGTNAQYYKDTHGDGTARREPKNHGLGPKADVGTEHVPPVVRQAGAEFVDAALSQLQKASRSSPHRRQQPSGIVGTVLRYILNTIPTGPATAPSQDQQHQPKSTANGPLAKAVDLLEKAARQNNSDAQYLLAELNFFGNYSYTRDLHAAYNYYNDLASSHGNTTAQYMLGLFHSTGIGNVVPRDQAKALLYYTFAAIRGDARAEMATAFRHHIGIGASKSCEVAVKYYKRVADKAIQWHRSGPPGGVTWIYQGWRIADDDGGVYGEGASAASSGMNARKISVHSDANAAISDVIEYLDLMSQKGDIKASLNLGRIFYDGQRGLEHDFDLAKKYFFLVASRYWKRDGRLVDNVKPGADKVAAKAAGFIGRMYLRGDGLPQNFERAKVWFERGAKLKDAQSQYGIGLMLLNGLGGKEDIKRASELFQLAAAADYAPAQVEIGRLYLDQGEAEDLRVANNFFELAARYGNIEAHYYLAEMIYHGVGRERTCNMALGYYKHVAEKAEPLVSSWADANDAYDSGDYEVAFLEYLMAAEQGYERAQNNVAYMLDMIESKKRSSRWLGKTQTEGTVLDNPSLALIHWTRSSRQSNIDSLVKMGDYYFYGIGTEVDVGKAVQCYTGASEYSQSAQALFNLGWMHENGIGLEQDFHLAKRYYDQALEVNEEAYLPVTMSLLKLRIRSAWNTITHGEVHSIQDEPSKSKDWSLAEWIANFMKDDPYYDEDSLYGDYMDDDTLDVGDEDYLDAGGIVESLLIIGVTLSLVLLLWYRQRMQQAHAQAEEARRQDQNQNQNQNQQPQPQPPMPGAPGNLANPFDGFGGWAAGGMGL